MNTSTLAQSAANKFEYTDWKEKMARIGHVAKGAVYGIAGTLTLMAAFNLGGGGQKAGKLQVIQFLENQAFGNILLILMAVGLACYAFFRFVQAAGKSESLQEKSDTKRKLMKAGFFVSGLLYLGLAVYAVIQVVSGSSGSGGKGWMQQILSNEWGAILFYIAAGAMLIKAIFQFRKVSNNEYYKGIRTMDIGKRKATKIVRRAGAWGYISRGILITITAYFIYQAAASQDASEIQGSSGAFSYLQDMTAGPWLVGAVAFGLICYAVYMFIKAKYKEFHIR